MEKTSIVITFLTKLKIAIIFILNRQIHSCSTLIYKKENCIYIIYTKIHKQFHHYSSIVLTHIARTYNHADKHQSNYYNGTYIL